jgi:hypothetical protein
MSLAALLPRLRRAPDLRLLVRPLLQDTRWERLDARALDPDGSAGVMSGGAWQAAHGLPWITLEARDAGHAARMVARACAAAGRPAGILCLDVARRRLAIAAATPDAPGLTIALERPDPVALAVLERLPSLRDTDALDALSRLADAVAMEPLGTRFFRQFRRTFTRFAEALPPGPPAVDRHALALLQLTRVLFLYFVQSKGWLDGRGDFLARAVDDGLQRGRRLHRDLLRPLFFGTLNRPVPARSAAARRFGTIPFLNGGLFAPHPLEQQWRADLSNAVWRDAFDDLFERFHFVTREGSDGAIAPDMLGRVFENLMEPDARHRSGTFYTPAPLVTRLLHDGLVALAAERLGIDAAAAARQVDARTPEVARLARSLTLLDPAAGSGAFLLGALELLAGLSRADDESASAARRRVLRDNLHGVDLNPTAVRLAELRLWLAVIADDDSDDPARVAPLPNLDAVVRQGDSLRGAQAAVADPRLTLQLRQARHAVLDATGTAKRRALAALRTAEQSVARTALEAEIDRAEQAVAAALAAARSSSLFGERVPPTRALATEIARWRNRRRTARAALRRLVRGDELASFDYRTHFADVMAGGGFDLVVGNPPWVRAEELPRTLRQELAERYRWFRTAGGRGYRNAPDLSVAFVERGMELLSPGGALALVVPAKLAMAGYAATLRHGLASGATLHRVAAIETTAGARFDATVYPMALVASRHRPAPGHLVASGDAGAGPVPQHELVGGGPWLLVGAGVRRVLARLAEAHPRLGEHVRARLGVKTGADDVFLADEPDIEPPLLRRAVRGRDVRAFRADPGPWLRWPCDASGAPLETLPPQASAWAARHRTALLTRADYRGGPAWAVFRTVGAVAPHRVVWADLGRRLTAAALCGPDAHAKVPLNTCYVAPTTDEMAAESLAALLNSTYLRRFARAIAPPAANGFHRFNARVVESLPCPEAAWRDARLAALAREGGGGADVQVALDAHVADLLGLAEEERRALADAPGHPR